MTARAPTTPTTIDLFCGAGGMVVGLHEAGFETALAVDNWRPACTTLEENFGGVRVLDADLATMTGEELLHGARRQEAPDVMTGGPPCQGFSSAGARRNGDKRNTLVGSFAVLVAQVRPRAFIFENVEGFLTAEAGDRVVELLDPLVEAGYRIHLRKINAANYGVPQLRKRVIGVGTLADAPPFPPPTHYAFGAPGARLVSARSGMGDVPTVAEALVGLAGPGTSKAASDHVVRASAADLERIAALGPGQTMRDLPEHLQHPSYRRRAFRRVMDGTPTERRGGAPAGLRRLVADEPSKAITGAAPRELIHPTEDRPLTLRECARLQTFPDSFRFSGTLSQKAVLIGNAVPPRLAAAVGRAVLGWLAENPTTGDGGPGGLVTFEPTPSEGMSPALIALTRRVEQRYGGFFTSRQEALWR